MSDSMDDLLRVRHQLAQESKDLMACVLRAQREALARVGPDNAELRAVMVDAMRLQGCISKAREDFLKDTTFAARSDVEVSIRAAREANAGLSGLIHRFEELR